jgi:hypothetical protein
VHRAVGHKLPTGSTARFCGAVLLRGFAASRDNASALRFFDPAGRLVRSVGRQGNGPGEFGALNGVLRCDGDSLFATDAAHGVSVFTAAGAFVRGIALPQFARLVACSSEGVLVVLESGQASQPQPGDRVSRVRTPVALSDRRGAITHELGDIAFYDVAQSGGGWLPQPGSPHTSFAVGRERLVVCPNDSGAVGVYSLRGRPLRPIPLDVPPRVPSRTYIEELADRMLAAMPVALKATFRQRLLEIPPAAHLPPCSKVLTDPDGDVWVILSVLGDSVTTLRVFGPDDRLLGDVTVPVEMDVLEIGSDYLLGSGEDADGEPWVRVYQVRRTATR